jgi:hypothetical protein
LTALKERQRWRRKRIVPVKCLAGSMLVSIAVVVVVVVMGLLAVVPALTGPIVSKSQYQPLDLLVAT